MTSLKFSTVFGKTGGLTGNDLSFTTTNGRTVSPECTTHPMDLATRLDVLLAAIAVWNTRLRQRRELRQLPDRMLRDIGVTRADAEFEASKPFWRC
jgi:uncharacterized protein YjiS (DUF1127 family)